MSPTENGTRRVDPVMLEAWCRELARSVPAQEIRRNPDVPYLTRYFLAGWNPQTKQPGGAVFLHCFHHSDPNGEVHSHPWGFAVSIILVGGYREYRCQGGRYGQLEVADYFPGMVNVLTPETWHRVELLAEECWTLFLVGSYANPWRFDALCEGHKSGGEV
jgi:hypothetical protein